MYDNMLFQELREFTTGLLNQLFVNLAGQDGQIWLEEFKKFLRQEPCWGATIKVAKKFLKRLYEAERIPVSATDSTETFAGSGVFPGGVYGLALPAREKKPTPAMEAGVWEMILDGKFSQLFESLGKNRRHWTESQVVEFCRTNRDKLRTGGYATFFEVEGGFVALVHVRGDGRLDVRVSSFSSGCVWDAEYRHRVVSLQQ